MIVIWLADSRRMIMWQIKKLNVNIKIIHPKKDVIEGPNWLSSKKNLLMVNFCHLSVCPYVHKERLVLIRFLQRPKWLMYNLMSISSVRSDSHSIDWWDHCLLRCDIMYSGISLPTFQRLYCLDFLDLSEKNVTFVWNYTASHASKLCVM